MCKGSFRTWVVSCYKDKYESKWPGISVSPWERSLIWSRFLWLVKGLLELFNLTPNSWGVTLSYSICSRCCFKSQDRIIRSLIATPHLETCRMILWPITSFFIFQSVKDLILVVIPRWKYRQEQRWELHRCLYMQKGKRLCFAIVIKVSMFYLQFMCF